MMSNIYSTGITKSKFLQQFILFYFYFIFRALILNLTQTEGTLNYMGCFLDNSANRDFKSMHLQCDDLTVESCLDLCAKNKFLYAAMQNGYI